VIHNPILPGFNPDPSILRVGEDYYIATSTFEWFPGVQIHHSRDLVHWRLLTRPLTRASQLEMIGNPNSGGIWAPCLTHDGELFHLIYTDVKTWGLDEVFKDTHNYLVTAKNITGEWSEPIYLNSSGFDPSLFHDRVEDGGNGRKWFLNMIWDHRAGRNAFGGILLQEYDPVSRQLTGEITNIFTGTDIRVTEGPHLYRKDGWYYLLTAEGGTSYEHAVTLARARDIRGPYEVAPNNPILCALEAPTSRLQKTGHASLVRTQTDEWYMVHLTGRPIENASGRYCPLGRETAIQRVEWQSDGWLHLNAAPIHSQSRVPELVLAGGRSAPSPEVNRVALEEVQAPDLPPHPFPPADPRDDFDAPHLGLDWQSLRVPVDESWLSLRERLGHLRLRGRESLISKHRQSLIGRRLQAFHATATTCLEFEPQHFQQMAGIVAYYDTKHWVYLRVSRDEVLGKALNLLQCDAGRYSEPLGREVSIEGWARVYLRVQYEGERFHFAYSSDGVNWQRIGADFESYKLSDDYCNGLSFTGTFVALCAQDLAGTRLHADFDFFEYQEFAL
jgi:xylan 1,4-beta-xylosidase